MSRQPGGYAYPSDAPAVAPAAAAAAAAGGGAKGVKGAAVDTAGDMDGRTRRPQGGYEYTYTSEQHFSYTSAVAQQPPPPPQSTTIDPSLQTAPSSSNVGARRKKMFGYLKAANELRQNYSAQLMQKIGADAGSSNDNGVRECPANFTDPLFSAQGDEQMVLFPTYAKRHRKRRPRDSPSLQRYVDQASERNDQQAQMELARWRAEWERYDNDRAVVDVDVRGWMFAPQRGQLNRKSRLLIGLAKRLSGIPSQPVRGAWDEGEVLFNADGSPHDVAFHEDEPSGRGSASNGGNAAGQQLPRHQRSGDSLYSTQEEIDRANAELMERLNPLLTVPLVEVPITIFFYNNTQSQSRTVITNDGGQFYIRVSLDFMPTQVRVLALENVSQTETVNFLEDDGVSLISDIDDTIKHTAITMGAKEIFRNTFVRKPETLTIDGVSEWYQDLARRGVNMHYVSNSPWQLYPQIELFFVLAGLPSGSFHLKRYSGLQEFFEPTVAKKRGALEMLLRDFPDRKFILVGDSGESDVEAYTELVLAHPNRILGVFIRDITTPLRPSQKPSSLEKTCERSGSDLVPHYNRVNPVGYSDTDLTKGRPPIPPRQVRSQQQPPSAVSTSPEPMIEEDLIDLSLDDDRPARKTSPPVPQKIRPQPPIKRKPAPPSLPAKPHALRAAPSAPEFRGITGSASAFTSDLRTADLKTGIAATTPGPPGNRYASLEVPFPPPPRKSSAANKSSRTDGLSSPPPPPPPPPPPRRRTTDAGSPDRNYRPQLPVRPPQQPSASLPLPPPQRQWPQGQNQSQSQAGNGTTMQSSGQIPTKQEEAWQRRWEKAQDILRRQNVVLVSWRVGSDVHELCVKMVEREKKETARKGGKSA